LHICLTIYKILAYDIICTIGKILVWNCFNL